MIGDSDENCCATDNSITVFDSQAVEAVPISRGGGAIGGAQIVEALVGLSHERLCC
jgi:hypothetical protein